MPLIQLRIDEILYSDPKMGLKVEKLGNIGRIFIPTRLADVIGKRTNSKLLDIVQRNPFNGFCYALLRFLITHSVIVEQLGKLENCASIYAFTFQIY